MAQQYVAGMTAEEFAGQTGGNNDQGTEQIYEQAQESHLNQTAQHLAAKHSQKVDNDHVNLDVEVQLQQLQQKLYRGEYNGPLEEQQLINQTEALAAQLTGASAPTESQEPDVDLKTDLVNELVNDPKTQETLQFAADNFDSEVSEAINEGLESASAISTQTAIGALSQIRKNPDVIGHGDVDAINELALNEIANNHGNEVADAIGILNANLVAGNITKGEAMRTAMKDSRVLNALIDASNQGLIKLAL